LFNNVGDHHHPYTPPIPSSLGTFLECPFFGTPSNMSKVVSLSKMPFFS
jgi:hypothetical protein